MANNNSEPGKASEFKIAESYSPAPGPGHDMSTDYGVDRSLPIVDNSHPVVDKSSSEVLITKPKQRRGSLAEDPLPLCRDILNGDKLITPAVVSCPEAELPFRVSRLGTEGYTVSG